jgi:D-alanine-D-alanine ligase-like ATP-grasp enzyme
MDNCLYCGENPIPHKTTWFYNSADIWLAPARKLLVRSGSGRVLDFFIDKTLWAGYKILDKLGLVRYNYDSDQVKFGRAKVLWQEATSQNIKMREIKPFGLAVDVYEATIGGKSIIFNGLPRPDNYDLGTLDWLDDKWLLKQKLQSLGIPVPKGGAATRLSQARKIFADIGKPVVVKPRKGSRGRHTTTFVSSEEELKIAFKIAQQICHWVVIEEQLTGPVYRATIINNNLVGILGGSPAQIRGNGVITIEQLISEKNKTRHERVSEVKITGKLEKFLNRSGYSLKTVLPKHKIIDLSEKVGIAYGGTSFDATDQTHPKTKQMFLKLAKDIDNPILGFDFILSDITKSYAEQPGGIIECNAAPFLNLHYDPLIGQTRNAAKYVWELVS